MYVKAINFLKNHSICGPVNNMMSDDPILQSFCRLNEIIRFLKYVRIYVHISLDWSKLHIL